jgi:hypothetical protein
VEREPIFYLAAVPTRLNLKMKVPRRLRVGKKMHLKSKLAWTNC